MASQRDSTFSTRDRPSDRPASRLKLQRYSKKIELTLQQVTAENLRKIFQVEPADSWLKNTSDDSVHFPDQAGNFDLLGVAPDSTLMVEGTSSGLARGAFSSTSSRISGVQSSVLSASSQESSSVLPPPPVFKSVAASKKQQKTLIRITKARIIRTCTKRKKPDFHRTGQLFVGVTETTANVGYVCEAVRNQWGDEYTVVTRDGFEIVDTAATQGTEFWKSPRRELYAVTYSDLQEPANDADYSDEDGYYEPPRHRRRKRDQLQGLVDEITSVKGKLNEVIDKHTVPTSWRQLLCDNFKCQICQAIINPPAVVTKCCKNILGCKECVDHWYSGPDAIVRSCPTCRAEDGNETMLLLGLNDLLEGIRRLYDEESGNQLEEQ